MDVIDRAAKTTVDRNQQSGMSPAPATMAPPEMTGASAKDTFYNDQLPPPPPAKRRHVLFWAVLSVVLFIVLGLGLGVGLGLGLHKPARGFSSPVTGPDCACSACPCVVEDPRPDIPTNLPPWRLPDEEYQLSMDWDIYAAPTTRVYNFTVEEIQAAPDGMSISPPTT